MKEVSNIYFSLIFRIGLIIMVLSSLFLFISSTTEFYDLPKFLVLLVFSGLILVLLTLKYTLQNRIVFIRTPVDLPLLLLLVVAAISTFLSPSPYVSLLGNQARISGSLALWVVIVLFYFLLTNSLRGLREVRFIFRLLTFAGAILSLLTLASYFGIRYLPVPFAAVQNFTSTGLPFSTAAILAMLLPIPLLEILGGEAGWGGWGIKGLGVLFKGLTSKMLNCLFLILYSITIALTGDLSSIVGGAVAVILVLVVARPSYKNLNLVYLIVPAVLVALVATLSFIPSLEGAKNPLYNLSRSYPREIQLDFITSWKVAVSSFRDHPFWGTGPATWLFDFTNYKPIEFNSSQFWNIRFDTAFNEYLHLLATLGGVGILALVSLTAMFISSAFRTLTSHLPLPTSHFPPPTSHFPLPTSHFSLPLAISGMVFFVILAFHSATLPVWVIGLLILASFCVLNSSFRPLYAETDGSYVKRLLLKIVQSQTQEQTIRVEALPGVLLIVSLALALLAFFYAGKYTLADYHHRLALNAISANNGLTSYNELVEAERLNPVSDLYRTDLAQVNFALANAIALAKGPTEASPTGSFTDQDRQNIQVLLQQSINEARTAVTLSPRSVINWEILAQLYRQISGVAENALLFSLDSFGRAIFQDPLNPNLRLNVGGTYYAIRNYDLAIRFFTDAINLKPDFANGFYNLSVALRDKGDLNAALAAAQQMVTLVDVSSSDYQVATDYLNDLKNRITPPTPAQPPAAQTSGALQQEQLPHVVNLPKPQEIATPSAIKKPGATPEPTPNP